MFFGSALHWKSLQPTLVRKATGTPVPGKSVKVPPGGRGSKMLSHNQATQPPSADYTLPEPDFPDVLDHPSTTSFNFRYFRSRPGPAMIFASERI